MSAPDVHTQRRVRLILWSALAVSVVMMFVVTQTNPATGKPEPNIDVMLLLIGALSVVLSVVLPPMIIRRAPADPASQAQAKRTALVLALALAESAAVFGMVAHFALSSSIVWAFFLVAFAGIAIHFPRN